jgi:hypothetical protein
MVEDELMRTTGVVAVSAIATLSGLFAAVMLGLTGLAWSVNGIAAGMNWNEESIFGVLLATPGYLFWLVLLGVAMIPGDGGTETRLLRVGVGVGSAVLVVGATVLGLVTAAP